MIECDDYFNGIFGATFLDNHIYPYVTFNNNIPLEQKSTLQLLFNIITYLVINGIVAYILRNILQRIPFPLENVYGFRHIQVKEVASGQLINFILLLFSQTIRIYIFELQRRYVLYIKYIIYFQYNDDITLDTKPC